MTSPSFCLLPWLSIAVRNNGDYRVCCHANTAPGRGLLRNDDGALNASGTTLDEARNSETLKGIRRTMLAGEWPESCVRCHREEAAGMTSKRQYSARSLPDGYDETWARSVTRPDGEIDLGASPLVDLDVRFGNKCNLACRMCGPSDSSLWENDFRKLGRSLPATTFDWHEKENFWNSLENRSDDLRHLYIVGGEPLLIERHYEFLQLLVDTDRAAGITLEYNTNLTILPERILALWGRFAKVRLGVSLDGVFGVNDYIRSPSRFENVARNLEKIDRAEGRFQIWLACTVSIYNLHHLVDFMRWVHDKRFERIGTTPGKEFFVPHPVHQPEHLNIQALPDEIKRSYENHLRTDLDRFLAEDGLSKSEKARAQEIVDRYIGFMNARSLSGQWSFFLEETRKIDRLRGQDANSLGLPFRI